MARDRLIRLAYPLKRKQMRFALIQEPRAAETETETTP